MKDMNIKIISKYITETLYITPHYQLAIGKSLLIILALIIIRFVVLRIADRKFKDEQAFYRFQKTTKYLFWVFLIVLVGRIWFQGIQSLATFFGLVSAGIAIALKDPLVNLAGFIYIFWDKPFEVGQRIEIGNVKGDVIDIGAFQFNLLEIGGGDGPEMNTGRILHLPNSKVFVESLANYDKTFPYIWDQISTQVTFESDWKAAKEIFKKLGEKYSLKYTDAEIYAFKRAAKDVLIPFKDFSIVAFTTVKDCGVEVRVRYMVNPRERGKIKTAMWEEILTDFGKEPNVDFAYPTKRIYNNITEGKVKGS